MRFAGTCKQYSKNAIPQLMRIAAQSVRFRPNFKCPYHAMVMNTLDNVRRIAVSSIFSAATLSETYDQCPVEEVGSLVHQVCLGSGRFCVRNPNHPEQTATAWRACA